MSFAEEAFASVALHEQTLVLVSKLVPQRVELPIVWAVHDVAEFMKHRVGDLLNREKLGSVAWVAKPQEDPLAPVHVQSEQIVLVGIEFTKL